LYYCYHYNKTAAEKSTAVRNTAICFSDGDNRVLLKQVFIGIINILKEAAQNTVFFAYWQKSKGLGALFL
jgi:hypothetical protein